MCYRLFVIVPLMVFMCKLNEEEDFLFFFLKFGHFKILVIFVLKLMIIELFPLLCGETLPCAIFL